MNDHLGERGRSLIRGDRAVENTLLVGLSRQVALERQLGVGREKYRERQHHGLQVDTAISRNTSNRVRMTTTSAATTHG